MQEYFGLLEMFIAFSFVLGIGILELVCLRLDRKRKQAQSSGTPDKP
ncbi:MAG: hypothetical protein ABW198_12710 [Pseudorhodoplanes sp.]